MKTNKVSGREAIGTYVLQFCVWGFERLRPLSRWEQGGVSRLIGFPLALAAGLIWSIYVAPIAFALSIILFYVESAFLSPKRWLVFNAFLGFVALGVASLSTGFNGIFLCVFCFWLAGKVWPRIYE